MSTDKPGIHLKYRWIHYEIFLPKRRYLCLNIFYFKTSNIRGHNNIILYMNITGLEQRHWLFGLSVFYVLEATLP